MGFMKKTKLTNKQLESIFGDIKSLNKLSVGFSFKGKITYKDFIFSYELKDYKKK